MDLGLKGKAALITGGSRGLGRQMALGLAAEGCHVFICARGEERLSQTLDELRALGVTAAGVSADVTKPEDAPRIYQAAVDTLGKVDILINNAGGARGGAFLDTSDADWYYTFELNVFGAIRLTRLALPALVERNWGRIIFIASIYGREFGGNATYQTAKSAIISLSKNLARELAATGVTVNSIAPGSIIFPGGSWQRRVDSLGPQWEKDFIERNLPRGRFGHPEEIAAMAVWMCSEPASLWTGTAVNVDGGQSWSLI